jgi:hypothetical protein
MVLRLSHMTAIGESAHQVDVGLLVQGYKIDSLAQDCQRFFVVIRKQRRKPSQRSRMPARKPVTLSTQPIVERRAAIQSETFEELPLDSTR